LNTKELKATLYSMLTTVESYDEMVKDIHELRLAICDHELSRAGTKVTQSAIDIIKTQQEEINKLKSELINLYCDGANNNTAETQDNDTYQYQVRYHIKKSGMIGDAVVFLDRDTKNIFDHMRKYIAHIESIVEDSITILSFSKVEE